jgi:hypothetical protein
MAVAGPGVDSRAQSPWWRPAVPGGGVAANEAGALSGRLGAVNRLLPCVLGLLAAALAQDLEPADGERSPRAARLRKQARAAWEPLAPLANLLGQNKPPAPEEAAAATRQIEEVVVLFEKALRIEWDLEANGLLAQAVRTWYRLQPHLPRPPAPADEAAQKKAAKEREKRHRARVRDVRRFITEYGRARRFEKQFRTCRRCDGRQFVYDAFNKGKRPCPACHQEGRLPIREGIIRARWHFHSPLYRASPGSSRDVRNALASAPRSPHRVAPFIRSLSIVEVEDHDYWMRVDVKEKTFSEPGSKKTVTTEKTYFVYRVGKSWFLYFRRFDHKLVDIPED